MCNRCVKGLYVIIYIKRISLISCGYGAREGGGVKKYWGPFPHPPSPRYVSSSYATELCFGNRCIIQNINMCFPLLSPVLYVDYNQNSHKSAPVISCLSSDIASLERDIATPFKFRSFAFLVVFFFNSKETILKLVDVDC